MKPRVAVTIQPRYRILAGKDIAFGPGKADLLEEVARSGSISLAAEHLGMSYMRAWTLIKTIERCFRRPLVKVSRGGAGHGGAQLTANGRRVLELYRGMESKSLSATAPIRQQLLKLLRS
jgi:molybdate transport system regulatory protein